MITVPEATKTIIERSRYLSEAMSKGLINYSSLARYIKPELEQMLIKKVSNASIIMALTRLEKDFKPKYVQSNIFKTKPEITVRSGLVFFGLPNTEVAGLSLLLSREVGIGSIFVESRGVNETSFVLNQDLFAKYKVSINDKSPLFLFENVSVVTINVPDEAINTPGIYYFFLKSLAWDGINILGNVTTMHEFTIVVEDKSVDRAFSIIKSLFV